MSYGILPQGFVLPTEDAILSEMQADAQVAFGDAQDLSIYDPIGQTIYVMEKAIYRQWQNLESTYYGYYIDKATGIQLDRVCKLGGVTRKAAISATVPLTFYGTDGTQIMPGDVTSQTGTGIQFKNTASGTIQSGSVTLQSSAVVPGATGVVPPNTINQLSTPFTGVTSVNNLVSSYGGYDVESDPALRVRFKNRKNSSVSSVPSLLLALQQINNVSAAYVIENATSYADQDGRDPHSIECVIEGSPIDADVAKAIYNNKAGGIETVGQNKSYNVIDSNGNPHLVKWTVPGTQFVNVKVIVTKNSNWNNTTASLISTAVVKAIGGVDTVGGVATQYPATILGPTIYAWYLESAIGSYLESILGGLTGVADITVYVALDPATPTNQRSAAVPYEDFGRADTQNVTVVLQ